MLRELNGSDVRLLDGRLTERGQRNRAYLMSLSDEHLLRNFELEAGRFTNREIDTEAMGGWESPTCQLRGHFLGHWLSAAALYFRQTGDGELRAKAEAIVGELAQCQWDNGGQWAASIPEKYLRWIGEGRSIWAPQYTIHKLFMGLADMYRYAESETALLVADRFADWFLTWSGSYDREQFDDILDYETGGMLEVWADLLEITGKEKYRTLLERYYRRRLFDPLVAGEDVLTNMHANTTIPEALGCARAYEVTGEKRWLAVAEAYWRCAVTERGCFATGGQTQGEIWTPKQKLRARLGERNQEHCTVYNMMRLAVFLFRETKDPAYLQYAEYNLYNGIMAQSYYRSVNTESLEEASGLLTYFLPMKAPGRKSWAGAMDSFFCCHGTMVQANARLNEGIYFAETGALYIGQYLDSDVTFEAETRSGGSVRMTLSQRQDLMNGLLQTSSVNDARQTVNRTAGNQENMPSVRKHVFMVHTEEPAAVSFCFRIPEWITQPASLYVNGERSADPAQGGSFAVIKREWHDGDEVIVLLPVGLRFIPLPDDARMGAFRFGPEVLVGITDKERVLSLSPEDQGDPVRALASDNERQWGTWLIRFRTERLDPGISFLPVNEIGREPYQMYFRIV
ncbi:beta-L-arabinofuranosidase domain-containing protein [Lachnoclostridium sp. Marseille-P6806]|uniref:beta-L-arabinofuranosidase domain-containing protein n=1 Tax=Lachnoclostridium sp. Marseille-P6806 TaxID=2364793 RepID=UPI001031351F|nr:beta-L-arabinofuranosidase domain-containing protein [Lachnoclostridium sp. Marseille-P6806]